IVFTTSASTTKANAMRRDSRVCICVDDETPPFAFVMVEGGATMTDDLDEMLAYATRIGGRYMGVDRAEEFGRRNAVRGGRLGRVTPTRILPYPQISD